MAAQTDREIGRNLKTGTTMAQQKFKGVDSTQEVDQRQLRPDTRRFMTRASEFFRTTDGVIAAMMVVPVLALILIKVPFASEVLLLAMWQFYRVYVDPGHSDPKRKGGKIVKYDFPFRVPSFAKLFDGSMTGNRLGTGITFLGKEISTKLEVWSGDSDLRTHNLVLGTTGSGKTEFLLGLVYNALVQNSGFIYTDGKGAVDLWDNVFRLARYLGREDDLVMINFLTSGRDFLDKQKDRTTNTMNPFAMGSSGMLIELIIALMDDSGGGGDMWKGRAIAFVAGLTRTLCFLRDRGYLLLDAGKFMEYFELPVIEKLVWDKTITEGGRDIKIEDPIFEKVLAPLRTFILTLPGYKKETKGAQEQKTTEQHGFITMQLTRLFGDLGYTYGYIFQTTLGEVDMYDVVINRRILVVLLPSLERAPDSLKMLGKLIVGAIKQMMAGCLGNRVEGSVREIVMARPTNAKVPFYVVLDEYGYYAVLGFAVAPAQARSLGFCITFAAQDFSSLQKASKEEADATWENTNVRIAGRMTGGKGAETFKRLADVADVAAVQEIARKEHESGAVIEGYRTVRDTQVTKVERLVFGDLAAQENGEFTILVGKKNKDGSGGVRIIRARTFYTQVEERPREIRINHYIKIEPPRSGSGDGDMDLELIEALEVSLKDMLASGKIKEVFPDDAMNMVRQNKPTPLMQIATYIRELRASQKLSLGEAVRVSLVCLDKEADVQQAQALQKLEEAKNKVARDRGELEESVAVVIDATVPATPTSDASSEFEIPSIDEPDDELVLAASPDGLPQNAPIDTDDGDGDGDAVGESGDGGSTGSANAGSGKGGGSSSGGASSTDLHLAMPAAEDGEPAAVPDDKAGALPAQSVGAAIRGFLDDDEYVIPDLADKEVLPAAKPATQISALTFRALGETDAGEESEQSIYLQDRISEVDLMLGMKNDVLEIKRDAQAEVRRLEKATSYVAVAKPEPATLSGVDGHITALLYAAENGTNDFR